MTDQGDAYQAYLLRLWRAPHEGEWRWHASIESRRTGEHRQFPGLEQLFAFLSERCGSDIGPQGPRETPGPRQKAEEA